MTSFDNSHQIVLSGLPCFDRAQQYRFFALADFSPFHHPGNECAWSPTFIILV